MNQDLNAEYCHEGNEIEGICADRDCLAQNRLYCGYCWTQDHIQCNQFSNLSYSELKFETIKIRQSLINDEQTNQNDINLEALNSVSQRMINQFGQLQYQVRQIKERQKERRAEMMQVTDNILRKELSKDSWIEGYQLIQKKIMTDQMQNKDLYDIQQTTEQLKTLTNQLLQFEQEVSIKISDAQRRVSNWQCNNFLVDLYLEQESNLMEISCVQCTDNQIVFSDHSGNISIWNPKKSKIIDTWLGHIFGIFQIKYSPDKECLVSASFDTTLRLWDMHTKQSIREMIGHYKEIYDVSYHKNGNNLVSCSIDKTIRIWDCRIRNSVSMIQLPNYANTVQFSPNGEFILSAGSDNSQITIFDRFMNKQLHHVAHQAHNFAYYTPDGKHIISNWNNELKVWNSSLIQDDQEQQQMVADGQIATIAMTLDGSILASATQNRIQFWDFQNRSQMGANQKLKFSGSESMVFSPNSQMLVVGGGATLGINSLVAMGISQQDHIQ